MSYDEQQTLFFIFKCFKALIGFLVLKAIIDSFSKKGK
jgi:hypothetical protein